MNFLRALTIGIRRGRVRDLPALRRETAAGAAYLAQGASYAYIRARSGTMGPRLMQDPGFGRGMERCKWEGFAACAQDLLLFVEGELRALVAPPESFWHGLYRQVLEAEATPAHRRTSGWTDRHDEFARRLARHRAAPPPPVAEIASHSGNVIIDFAPVEEAIRAADREMVVNNVRFRFIDYCTALRRRLDHAALAEAIAAGGGIGP